MYSYPETQSSSELDDSARRCCQIFSHLQQKNLIKGPSINGSELCANWSFMFLSFPFWNAGSTEF